MDFRKTRAEETSEFMSAAMLAGTELPAEKAEANAQLVALTQIAYSVAVAADALVEIKNILKHRGF